MITVNQLIQKLNQIQNKDTKVFTTDVAGNYFNEIFDVTVYKNHVEITYDDYEE